MKTALKILIAASFIYNFSAGLFGPIYAIFVEGIGGNILDAGMAWAIYSIAIGVATFIFSRFEDGISKEKAIVAGYALTTVGFLGYYFVDTIMQLFIVELFFGIITAFHDPVWEAFFSQNVSKKKEAREWGDWESGKYIFVGIAALVGSYIAFQFSFKLLFIMMTAISAISTVISYMLVKVRK
jgi:MFS family permease